MPKRLKKKRDWLLSRALSPRASEIAHETVAEELRTRKYPRRQAVAIGLSRAREQARHEHAMATAREYL